MTQIQRFKQIVRDELALRNWPIIELSRQSGVDSSNLWRFIKGIDKDRGINFETVAKILKAFDFKFSIFDRIDIKPITMEKADNFLPTGSDVIDKDGRIRELESVIKLLKKELYLSR